MKIAASITSTLLGIAFSVLALLYLLNLVPMPPPPPEGSPPALFMGALVPTGYMTFIKVLEIVGGVLLIIPRTRNFGLLVLGPIIVNILAFHVFILKGAMLLDPVLILICLLTAFVLWFERKSFLGLLRS
jgi:putative oxidoreductase